MISLKMITHQFDLELTNRDGISEYYRGFEPTFDQFKSLMAISNPEQQAEALLNTVWPSLMLGSLSLSTIQQLTNHASTLLEDNAKKK